MTYKHMKIKRINGIPPRGETVLDSEEEGLPSKIVSQQGPLNGLPYDLEIRFQDCFTTGWKSVYAY